MKSNERSSWHLIAALTTCAALVACGGGGGGGGGGSSVGGPPSPVPSPAPPSPPPPPPPAGADVTIDFEPGRVWHYAVDLENNSLGGTYSFTGERVLYAERELTWQGRTAWKVTEVDERREGPAKFGFTLTTRYFAQGPEGLDHWVGTETAGVWRRLLSRQSLVFANNGFLWAGKVESGRATNVELQVPIATPAGSFTTAEAGVDFRDNDSGAGPSDILESHHEYYADGVGIVLSTWNVEFDDNDGNDSYDAVGVVELLEVGSGPEVRVEAEPVDNNSSPASSQAVSLSGYLRGQTQLSDAGTVTVDANVLPNFDGARRLQDFYRFTVSTQGQHLVTLVDYSAYVPEASRPDLDLYLFLEGPGGTLTYKSRSTRDPVLTPGGEQIEVSLTTGNYLVAVQAWNTPAGAAPYWLSVR
ncbi:MAG TPA: hypothetical protein VFO82_13475 [Steroidobacteraceae bacterium]|nr:hypothetical protein [Steroidobacteraceae bacterium]